MCEQLCEVSMPKNGDYVLETAGPCLLKTEHEGDHLCRDEDGNMYRWIEDYDCGCDPDDENCRGSDDFTDSCFTWDRVTFEEAKRLIKEQT